jgi:replication fork protection complex subunit Csm3/Swi3
VNKYHFSLDAVTRHPMDTDINDIWDLPVETPAPHIPLDNPDGEPPTSSPRAPSAPLFLPSDDDEDTPPTANAPQNANANADIDALFEGLDDFQELAPALDLDALRREADARNARAVRAEMGAGIPAAEPAAAGGKTNAGSGGGALDGIDGDGEDGGKKKRKPVARLDETRLLGKDGFPQLVKDTKNFKPKGKGHEVIIFIMLLSFPPAARLTCGLTRPRSESGPGPRAPSVPILDPQIIS